MTAQTQYSNRINYNYVPISNDVLDRCGDFKQVLYQNHAT